MKLSFLERVVNKFHGLLFKAYKYKIKSRISGFYSGYIYESDYELKKLNKLYQCAKKEVSFYRSLSLECFSLHEFPVMSKSTYREFGEKEFQSKYLKLKPKYIMNTGGSTGHPFEFYADLRAAMIDSLHQEAQHKKAGFEKGDKIYVFNGCEIPQQSLGENIFWKEKRNKNQLPFGSKEFSSHYLNKKNIKHYLEELNQNPPQFIRSYPSVFHDFTKLLILLGYKSPPFHLKGIQLTSEITTPEQESVIKNYWGNIVYFQYGHSEVAVIASKYPNENCYTFSPIYGVVEILDEKNQHVAPNEIGRIIVTSLHNTVRPFIRYDTGDLALFKENENGIVKVYDIVGRSQDYVVDKFNNKIAITGLVFGQHFHAFKNILSWQIINILPGDLNVRIVKMEDYSHDDEQELREKLEFNGAFNVRFSYVNEIEKTVRGKHRLVINQ